MTDDVFTLRYEHAFDIRINFEHRMVFGPVSGGSKRGYTSVGTDCVVSGPKLNGKLVDRSGGDWPEVRSDGVVDLNAHYVIEADDGTLIYIRNQGYIHGTYFRCTPYFRAPIGPHDWLNRTVIVGIGQRKPKVTEADPPDHSLFRYFSIL